MVNIGKSKSLARPISPYMIKRASGRSQEPVKKSCHSKTRGDISLWTKLKARVEKYAGKEAQGQPIEKGE